MDAGMIEGLMVGDVVVVHLGSHDYVGTVVKSPEITFVRDRIQPAVLVSLPRGQFGKEGEMSFFFRDEDLQAF